MKIEIASHAATRTQTSAACARWMVVDDDDSVRNFIVIVLTFFDVADVTGYRSSSEALAALTARPDQYSLVITDLDMPGMTGLELCRQLRAVAPQVKIVLATGNGAVNPDSALRDGFDGLLIKPFVATDVWRLIEALGAHANMMDPNP